MNPIRTEGTTCFILLVYWLSRSRSLCSSEQISFSIRGQGQRKLQFIGNKHLKWQIVWQINERQRGGEWSGEGQRGHQFKQMSSVQFSRCCCCCLHRIFQRFVLRTDWVSEWVWWCRRVHRGAQVMNKSVSGRRARCRGQSLISFSTGRTKFDGHTSSMLYKQACVS